MKNEKHSPQRPKGNESHYPSSVTGYGSHITRCKNAFLRILCLSVIGIIICVSVIADVDYQKIWRDFSQQFIAIRNISGRIRIVRHADAQTEISFDFKVMDLHDFWLKFTAPELLKDITLVVDTNNHRIYSSYPNKGTIIRRNMSRKEVKFYDNLVLNIITFLTHINTSEYTLSFTNRKNMFCFTFSSKNNSLLEKLSMEYPIISVYLSSDTKMLKEIHVKGSKSSDNLLIYFSDIKLHDEEVKDYFNSSLPYPLEYLP